MPIITISRGSYSFGKRIAETVAQKLGYACIARETLIEASEEFNIPGVKLLYTFQDAPSIFDRISSSKQKYIAYIQSAILKRLQKDNVVYHGFAGHFFVKDIPHAIKVRVVADLADRAKNLAEENDITEQDAISAIEKLDEQRSKWSRLLYGIDISDPIFYNLVLNIRKISVDDAVDLLMHAASLEIFQATAESQAAMDDLVLAAEVKAALIEVKFDIDVSAQNGAVYVNTSALRSKRDELQKQIQAAVSGISGIKELRIHMASIGS